jgi:hypothetical protein
MRNVPVAPNSLSLLACCIVDTRVHSYLAISSIKKVILVLDALAVCTCEVNGKPVVVGLGQRFSQV